MSWVEILCRNRTCHGRFKVDESLGKRKCHDCGTIHYAPWHSPNADLGERELDEPRSSPTGYGELECSRCEETFDSDRDPTIPKQNTHRCPKCGHDNTVRTPDTIEETASENAPAVAGGGGGQSAAGQLNGIVNELADSGGDVHIHLHNDG